MNPAAQSWLTLHEEDRRMAKQALDMGIHRQCVHHSQQMIEKLLKALWVDKDMPGYPPRSHSLLRVWTELGLDADEPTARFLEDLTGQYLPSKYGDVMVDYSRESAEHYFQEAVRICQQLLPNMK